MKFILRSAICLWFTFFFFPAASHAFLDDFRRDLKERFDIGQSYGLYLKVLEVASSFDSVCERIEKNISQSDWEMISHWDLTTPEVCSSRARVYLLENHDYNREVLSRGVRHLIFLPVRIGVYQEGDKVVVVFTNPEFLSKVFFADLPFTEQDKMMAASKEVKKDLVTFCVKGMEGTILTEQLPPIRNDRDVRFFWSRHQDHLDVVKRVPVREDAGATLNRVCEGIIQASSSRTSSWRAVFRSMVDDRACIIGVTQKNIEDQALNYSGLKWPSMLDRDPCSGIYHLTQFPLEILVFVEEGEVRVSILDQFWRMRFYLWDNPYRTGSIFLARDPNFSGRIYESLIQLIQKP